MTINPSDIAVVIQGKINKTETQKCIKSVQKYLAGAQIIISTYQGQDASGLDCETIIFNQDPMAVPFAVDGDKKIYNNLNRQLLSTQEGLKKAERKYVLKLRSDLILTSRKLLDYFDKYQARCDEYKLFERKIIVPTMYSRKFVIKHATKEQIYTPFHPSDWFFFGLKTDVEKLFAQTPLVQEPEYSTYFQIYPENKDRRYHTISTYQYPPEQYFMLKCMQRNFPEVQMKDLTDVTESNILQSEIAMVNNFIVLEYKQHGIYLNKYEKSKCEKRAGFYDAYGLYFNDLYLADYKKHCDKKFKIPFKNRYKGLLEIEPLLFKLYDHIERLFDKNEPIKRRLSAPISVASYCSKIIRRSIKNIAKLSGE